MKKNPHAVALGRAGGRAWAASLTKEERHDAALKAGLANKKKWEKKIAARFPKPTTTGGQDE